MDVDLSVDGAREARQRGELDRWVADYLSSPASDHAVQPEHVCAGKVAWMGPIQLPFDDLLGPDDAGAADNLAAGDLAARDAAAEDVDSPVEQQPPLIVSCTDGKMVVEDGAGRIERLRRAGRTQHWSVIGFDDDRHRCGVDPDER